MNLVFLQGLQFFTRLKVAISSYLFFMLAALAFAMPVLANDGFTGGVSPSRFELKSKAGDVVRRSVEIYNLGAKPSKYRVRTVDWTYSSEGQIGFSDQLLDNSCRPWVRIEQHEVSILPGAKRPKDFRFEVRVPEDATKSECRFALMIEGVDDDLVTQLGSAKNIALPINGRIAVIVYLGINGAKPDLEISKLHIVENRDNSLPALEVVNNGDAHGRLESELTAKTADGKKVELVVASSPILAGQTRYLTLTPVGNKDSLTYPLAVKGRIFSDRHTFKIDSVVDH